MHYLAVVDAVLKNVAELAQWIISIKTSEVLWEAECCCGCYGGGWGKAVENTTEGELSLKTTMY